MRAPSKEDLLLYKEYSKFYDSQDPGPRLWQELVKRNRGKIKVLALDLEYTLLDTAYSPWPRPGLFEFLEKVKGLFERIVIYTAVKKTDCHNVIKHLVSKNEVPPWLADIECVHWERLGKKNLKKIKGIELDEALIVDDQRGYIHPTQLFQWIPIEQYDTRNYYYDKELDKVLAILEMVQFGIANQSRIINYLKDYVDDPGSGVKKLWVYGDFAKSDGGPESALQIAMETDPEAEVKKKSRREKSIADVAYLRFQHYLWVGVEIVDHDSTREAIEIKNYWEKFNGIFTRSEDRIDIAFPDFPGCAGVHKKDEENADIFDKFMIHAIGPASEILEKHIETLDPNEMPRQKLSEEDLKTQYPDSNITGVWVPLPK